MASKRRLRRRSCDAKVRFATEAAALAARHDLRGLQAYKCRHCSGWHLGHPPTKVRQAIAARRGTIP